MTFAIEQFDRGSIFSKPSSVSAVVFLDSAFEVISDAGVEFSVLTFDNVDVPRHGRLSVAPVLKLTF